MLKFLVISFAGCIQVAGFCAFEACVGIFWPSIMKMRSQYIPEEASSTIMNFFRIPLNIFVCIVLYNVCLHSSKYLNMFLDLRLYQLGHVQIASHCLSLTSSFGLSQVNAFPITVMFGMCSIFLFVACLLQRRLMVIADKPSIIPKLYSLATFIQLQNWIVSCLILACVVL